MKNGVILSYCRTDSRVVIDPAHGRDGAWGASVLIDGLYFFVKRDDKWEQFQRDLLAGPGRLACWDLRRMLDWPLDDRRVVWEVKSLHGGAKNLPALARERGCDSLFSCYLELDRRMVAHGRALKTVDIALPSLQAAPIDLIRDWLRARASAIQEFFSNAPETDYEDRWPFVRAVREMERNGIHVDLARVARVAQALQDSPDQASASALRSLQSLCKDGLVSSLCNPMGGKTGRLRHEGGFNAMAVPHGPARLALTSRFEGGQVCTFDFNAIDYRCIVRSVGGEVARLYEGARDFHERTASFVFKEVRPDLRESVKFLSYIYIYGGSDETLVAKTGWTLEHVKQVLERLDRKVSGIPEFRQRLWMEATEVGYVEVPGGRQVPVGEDDSPGKVIGLYAQSYSSWVFEQAMVRVQQLLRGKQSRLAFAVHDELVVDVHPDELGLVEEVRKLMEWDGHVVVAKRGISYGEQQVV